MKHLFAQLSVSAALLILSTGSLAQTVMQRCVSPNGQTTYAERCPDGLNPAGAVNPAANPSKTEVSEAQARAQREQEAAKQADARRQIEDAKRANAKAQKPKAGKKTAAQKGKATHDKADNKLKKKLPPKSKPKKAQVIDAQGRHKDTKVLNGKPQR